MSALRDVLFLTLGLAACGESGGGGGSAAVADVAGGGGESGVASLGVPAGDYRVLAVNDLGMHCIDRDFSVFSILPPFNVLRVQVVQRDAGGRPRLLGPSEVDVTYEGVADASGSINTKSKRKTDFWDHEHELFGVDLPLGSGVTGLYMPADAPTPGPQPIAWKASEGLHEAFGIPITDIDDAGLTNPYPLLRVRATSPATGQTLATLDVVVPVSSETDCSNCHLTGGIAADDPGIAWSTDPDGERQSRENVLLLHDARRGTDLISAQSVLCATCHRSPPLDLGGAGPAGGGPSGAHPFGATITASTKLPGHTAAGAAQEPGLMSAVMHGYHGRLVENGSPVFPPGGDALSTCYQCHPGAVTECLRGAMFNGGMQCLNCHGDMLAVGGDFPLAPGGSIDGTNDGAARRPWQDLPRCSSCHTGDAVNHLTGAGLVFAADGIRLTQAWRTGDPAASPIAAPASRFAEEPDTLYRFSKGHSGISCESCHGSTHAEWPNADPDANDNVAAVQLQGHTGPITECTTCHVSGSLSASTLDGPHGMHVVDDLRFVDHSHASLYENHASECRACHGTDLLGSVLSRAADDRHWDIEDDLIVDVQKGTAIGCNLCHGWPMNDDD